MVGAVEDDDDGTDSGSAYVFRYNNGVWFQEAKLTAIDGATNDSFGISVSISGDTAVVGAVEDDDGVTDSGSAYVFRYNGSAWDEGTKLTASDGDEDDHFGNSVSISGNTVVVGAVFGDKDLVTDSGSAYLFRYNGSAWDEGTKLTASDGANYDRFGASVSISGDMVVVGAIGDDDKGTFSGSAYVFTCEFAPTSPEEVIEQIIEDVENLVFYGELNKGEGNALISKLNTAMKKFNEDNTKAACNVLQAFINQINAKIRSEKLLSANGQLLIAAASSVSVCN